MRLTDSTVSTVGDVGNSHAERTSTGPEFPTEVGDGELACRVVEVDRWENVAIGLHLADIPFDLDGVVDVPDSVGVGQADGRRVEAAIHDAEPDAGVRHLGVAGTY